VFRMELTEKERLMLVGKKEEIRKLTTEILNMMDDPKKQSEIKKKMTSILSLLSTIASYSESKNYNLDAFTQMANVIFTFGLEKYEELRPLTVFEIETFCNYVNSVQFDFTKRGLKIRIPKIDVSIFRAK